MQIPKYTQTLTDNEQTALAAAISGDASSAGLAKLAAQKVLYSIACSAEQLGLSTAELIAPLAGGAGGTGASAVLNAIAMELRILGDWGTLVIQGAGFVQIIAWATKSASWLAGVLGTIGTFTGDVASGAAGMVAHPLATLGRLFGITRRNDNGGNAGYNVALSLIDQEVPMLGTIIAVLSPGSVSVQEPSVYQGDLPASLPALNGQTLSSMPSVEDFLAGADIPVLADNARNR